MEKNSNANKRARMESEYDVKDIIVIDNGADTVKVGISGEDNPRLIIETVAGIPEQKADNEGTTQKSYALFGEALKKAKQENKFHINEKRPIHQGRIKEEEDFNIMKDLWVYALDQGLQVNEISACNLLIIDSPLNKKDYKYDIAEILFEEMKVNSILFMNSATLSLFSTGTTSGLVLECGHSLTTCTPIFEGFPMAHAQQYSYIAGEEMTRQLDKGLKENKIEVDWDIVKDIKEKMCHVAKDYYVDVNSKNAFTQEERSYELPDGTVLEIENKERYTTTEILFNPSIINDQSMSIPEMMIDSLKRCDPELQNELHSNIVLCGGSSLFYGFQDRIQKELFNLLPPNVQRKDVNFVSNTHRRYSAWIGGSMLGSLSTFQSLAITRTEFEENPEVKQTIIQKKTF